MGRADTDVSDCKSKGFSWFRVFVVVPATVRRSAPRSYDQRGSHGSKQGRDKFSEDDENGSVSVRVVGPALLILVVSMSARTTSNAAEEGEVWTFDRVDRIGGHSTTVLGSPRVIDTPLGKAVEFN